MSAARAAFLLAATMLAVACAATPLSRAAAWRHVVGWSAAHDVLRGESRGPAGARLAFAPDVQPFVDAVAERGDGTWSWRLRLGEAARNLDDDDRLAARGSAFVASLAMLLPATAAAEPVEVRFEPPPAEAFAIAGADGAVADWRGDLEPSPLCVFGSLALREHVVDAAHLTVVETEAREPLHAAALQAHVDECARAVAAWFGAFPVAHLLLVTLPARGDAIGSGRARGDGGASICCEVPRRADARKFAGDWVLIHEMVHLALPSLPPAQHWLEEGSATYLEPLIQAAAGRLTPEQVWRAMLDEYGQGLAPPERGGLDDDRSWGRTYYGGALFCLCADVRIRERTHGRHSLQDALRAVVAGGADVTQAGAIDDVLAIGDRATGTTVLNELRAATATRPLAFDLDALWRDLGVRRAGDGVAYDDMAPLAAIRRALVPVPPRGN